MLRSLTLALAGLALLATACDSKKEAAPTPAAAAAPAAAPTPTPAANTIPADVKVRPGEDGQLKGKVAERLEGGGYVYLRLAQGEDSVWAAVPTATAQVGDEATVAVQTLMTDFNSKSLNRTFDKIYFGTVGGAAAMPANGNLPPGHPSTAGANVGPIAPGKAEPAAAQYTGKVVEVLEVPSYTYLRMETDKGELWAAVSTAKVAVGQTVVIGNAAVMDGFSSPRLQRKFDHIVFGTLVETK